MEEVRKNVSADIVMYNKYNGIIKKLPIPSNAYFILPVRKRVKNINIDGIIKNIP